MPTTVGILAGGGPLPARVAEAAHAAGQSVFIIGFDGFADPTSLAPWPHECVRLGAAGRMLSLLREHACSDLVLIGPIRRPSLRSLCPDAEGARILARLARPCSRGMTGCWQHWCVFWGRRVFVCVALMSFCSTP